ncbi:MAG TPA: hypothetical protein VHQ95_14050 [Pyrinomonadaceae bacterium]|jgi:hypothetical protein|nr:hypothetical protein [Pyrinomonadaceae bacterium]
MADDPTIQPGEDINPSDEEERRRSRRDFLVGLRKWSAIIIGSAVLGGALPSQEAKAAGWVNGRGGGGGWLNGRSGGGGGGWINGGGGGGWINGRGGGWINR